jgi:hypothetical protein
MSCSKSRVNIRSFVVQLFDLALRTAAELGVECDQVSFTAVLAHTRAMLCAAAPCPRTGRSR